MWLSRGEEHLEVVGAVIGQSCSSLMLLPDPKNYYAESVVLHTRVPCLDRWLALIILWSSDRGGGSEPSSPRGGVRQAFV